MNKYYIVQVLEKDKEEVHALIEQRFEENQLEQALQKMSLLQKCMDTERCIIEIVKWQNDAEVDVIFAIQEEVCLHKDIIQKFGTKK